MLTKVDGDWEGNFGYEVDNLGERASKIFAIRLVLMAVPLVALILLDSRSLAAPVIADPDARAAAAVASMTPAEKTVLTHGVTATPSKGRPVPAGAVPGAGYISGISRLAIPALTETDASLGVAYVSGARKDGATALPSGMAMGATWNPGLLREAGAMIGGEARAKGFNVLLAGGDNLVRDPRGGRTFEYLSEDPVLSGNLAGAAIDGVQSVHVLSTAKHFALNDQETARHFADVKISDAAARESDLLAFEIAIERGRPGAIMCAYNQVGGAYACDSDYLLNAVLKSDWGYKGFVMSDWGAVPRLEAARHGLDQQSGAKLDPEIFFGEPLADAAAKDPRYAARLTDMNLRILRSIYAVGADLPTTKTPIDFAADGAVARRVAEEAIVLLRNRGNALPIAASAKKIVVIGGYADSGVLSGGGSSQVEGEGGPSVSVPKGGGGPFANFLTENYQRSSPLKAITALAPGAEVVFRRGDYITDAVAAAKGADVVIVFATQWMTEGLDVPDISLPHGQDALIDAVASVNPHTVVVLETGGPVAMPWLEKTAAVLEAWYPGARGGDAIAAVLFGQVNPSGRLSVTFPVSAEQLPRPVLPGSDVVEPNFVGTGAPGQTLTIDYDIEGSDVGYRWFARRREKPAFAFGFGLSYSDFKQGALVIKSGETLTAEVEVTNTGQRAGAEVVQIYAISDHGERLAGFQKVQLAPGASRVVTVGLEQRVLADWTSHGWRIPKGRYVFAAGKSANDLGAPVAVQLAEHRWHPS